MICVLSSLTLFLPAWAGGRGSNGPAQPHFMQGVLAAARRKTTPQQSLLLLRRLFMFQSYVRRLRVNVCETSLSFSTSSSRQVLWSVPLSTRVTALHSKGQPASSPLYAPSFASPLSLASLPLFILYEITILGQTL